LLFKANILVFVDIANNNMFGRSFAVLAVILVIVSAQQNLRPVIGIVTEPTSPSLAKYGNSFISAGYVKFVEMAGARVVPIPYLTTVAV